MLNQTKKNFKFDIAPATTPKSSDSCVAARKISKVAVEAVRRELAFKKIKLESGSAPLLNKRSLVLGMRALLLTLVSVGVVPLILSSGISRYKPDPVRTTKRSLDRMARALGRYRFHVGTYPTNEEGLEVLVYCQPEEVAKIRGAHPGWKGPYVDRIVKDPWGGEFVYEARKDGDYPILYSCGPDRKAGTADDLWPHQALFDEQSWDTSWTKFWLPVKLPECKKDSEKTKGIDVESNSAPDEFDDLDNASDIIIPLFVGIITFIVSWLFLYLIFSRRR